MFIYECGPIDLWYGWQNVCSKIERDFPEEENLNMPLPVFNMFIMAMGKAAKIAWEGDVRGNELYYTGIVPLNPHDCECEYMVAWKQDNNGTTFIASPNHLYGYDECMIYPEDKVHNY